MKKLLIGLFALMVLVGCGSSSSAQSPSQRLNGTWESNVMTVTIDFNSSTYNGVALGEQFNKTLKLVSENENVVVFLSDDATITAQIQDDNHIILKKDKGLPIALTRSQ